MVKTANEMELYRRELLKGSTETLLLSLLSEEPKYGYQLVREMDARSGGYFHLEGRHALSRSSPPRARRPNRKHLVGRISGRPAVLLLRHDSQRSCSTGVDDQRMESLRGRPEPDHPTDRSGRIMPFQPSHRPQIGPLSDALLHHLVPSLQRA